MTALLETAGRSLALADTPIAILPFQKTLAFVAADGSVYLGTELLATLPSGALCAATGGAGRLLIGAEDGALYVTDAGGAAHALTAPLKKWIEHVAAVPDGHMIAAVGRQVILVGPDGAEKHRWSHESAVTGLALDPKGKRFAASHYNGVSLWWLNSPAAARTLLEWKGSHTGVSWSPDGKFVVTAMQELALHGWRVADKANMRMAGYPSKTKSMVWTQKGKYLATSGAPPIVCWPFHTKDGPMGKAPLELPTDSVAFSTAVACHPARDIVAAGYQDGAVLLFRMEDQADLQIADGGGAAVAALGFSADGTHLAFAREDGSAGIVDLTA